MEINLESRLQSVNEIYFGFSELPPIRWSKGVVKKKYRKLTFGTYDIKKNQIRIHPLLKNNLIPALVLDFVIYHELLHYEDRAELQDRLKGTLFRKRKRVHTVEFHKREKAFEEKKEAARLMQEIVRGVYQPVLNKN